LLLAVLIFAGCGGSMAARTPTSRKWAGQDN
jgi:hypothetical protein